MTDFNNLDKKENSSEVIGQIQISEEVISVIAGTAALEIEGVKGVAGNITGEIIEKFGRKNQTKGVRIKLEDQKVWVHINLVVKSGHKIPLVSAEVQKRVKTALETMTSLTVVTVNVKVVAVSIEKPKKQDKQQS